MAFLSAHWRDLIMVNYEVAEEVLLPYVPRGTEIDRFEGRVYASLVAFHFTRTRVLGIPWPGHVNFEEVNLRFYVRPLRDPSIRAVTFVREIVPKRVIPWIANSLFDERYEAMPMSHRAASPRFEYGWGRELQHRVAVEIDSGFTLPEPGSEAEFITEHYWGYAQGKNKTREYRVEHPQWRCAAVRRHELEVDFAELYGKEFGVLNGISPASVLFAEGSAVTVSAPGRLD